MLKRRRRRSISSQLGIRKSASFGPKGAKVNVSKSGIKSTTKNPITGKRKSKTLYSSKSGCATSVLMMNVLAVLIFRHLR